jgi:hypothetical protein
MKNPIPLLVSFCALLLMGLPRAEADPLAEISSFSVFKDIDLAKLGKGEVMATRGPVMSFPRGLSLQFCYVVPAPIQSVIALQKSFDGSRHPDLKVYLHSGISSPPSPRDFSKMGSAPGNSSVKSLADATEKLDPGHPALQMSIAEAKAFGKSSGQGQGGGGALPPSVRSFWSSVLLQRATAFASRGLSGQPPYADSSRASEDAAAVLKEEGKIRSRFPALVDRLNSPSGASLYWELFDVEGRAAFSLGALYSRPTGEGWQGMDVGYYASGGYNVYLTFFEFWPVKIGDRPATLVWRGDLLASAALADLHGVERVGAAGAMKKTVQKTIDAFLKEASR